MSANYGNSFFEVCLEINFTNLRGVLGCGALVVLLFFYLALNIFQGRHYKKSKHTRAADKKTLHL